MDSRQSGSVSYRNPGLKASHLRSIRGQTPLLPSSRKRHRRSRNVNRGLVLREFCKIDDFSPLRLP